MGDEKASVGIILVSHGNYGSEILKTAESILGPQSDCVSISVDVARDVDESVRRLNDAAGRLDYGAGVILLTDMFGGTATNLALSLLRNRQVEVVTGVNLPMLLKVFESRATTALADLAALADEAGKGGIVITGKMLRARNREKS